MREDDIRELLLLYGEYVQFPNERSTKAAMSFLLQFKFPLRIIARGLLLELGANSDALMRTAIRLIKAHGFTIVKRHPWVPPMELHDNFKFDRLI